MNDPACVVDIAGSATFTAASYDNAAGYYTAGLMTVGGDFAAPNDGRSTSMFQASGTHTVRLTGASAQVSFADATNSYFRRLEIASGAAVTFMTNVRTLEDLECSGSLTTSLGTTTTVSGALRLLAGAVLDDQGVITAASCNKSPQATVTGTDPCP